LSTPAGPHRGLESPVVAQLNLGGEQLLDRVRGGQRAAIDVLEDAVERFERPGMRRSARL
jgi:hypothetical protein